MFQRHSRARTMAATCVKVKTFHAGEHAKKRGQAMERRYGAGRETVLQMRQQEADRNGNMNDRFPRVLGIAAAAHGSARGLGLLRLRGLLFIG